MSTFNTLNFCPKKCALRKTAFAYTFDSSYIVRNLFTFNPANKAQGKNPFTLTSKAVDNEKYQALLANETRYSRLTRAFPDRAKELFARNQEVANDRYEHLTRLVDLYK